MSACASSAPKDAVESPLVQKTLPFPSLLIEIDAYLQVWNNAKLSENDPEAGKKIEAAEFSIQKKVEGRLEEFLSAAESGSLRNRMIAITALGFCKDSRVLPILIRSLGDPESKIIGNALVSLGVLGSVETPLDRMIELLLHHPEADVRVNAAYALQKLAQAGARHPSLIESLHAALRDTEPGVRAQAAASLGTIHNEESVPLLISLLKDSKPLISAASAFALGEIRDSRAVDPLVIAMESRSPRLREAARQALIQITGEDHGDRAWDWKKKP